MVVGRLIRIGRSSVPRRRAACRRAHAGRLVAGRPGLHSAVDNASRRHAECALVGDRGAGPPRPFSVPAKATSMTYPIPLQVHVVWHPGGDALCRPLAERIYVALSRDPDRPLLPGIGIPVFFRCGPAAPGAGGSTPRPIEVGADTEFDLRLALVTPELAVDDAWLAYLDASEAEV